jgi:hypothetical protein
VLEPQDVARRRNIPVTSPARTLIDLSSVLPYKRLRRATREAHRLKLVTITELTQRLGRGRGRANLRRIIAAGIPPTRSELEDAFLDLCAHGGLQPPRVNEPMHLDGRRVIPDFRWPGQRLVVEPDGAEWHGGRVIRVTGVDDPQTPPNPDPPDASRRS